jgi:hypothetical protein
MLGPKKGEVTGSCRKLHNEELHNLHTLPNNITVSKGRMRWAGHVARMREMRNADVGEDRRINNKKFWEEIIRLLSIHKLFI